ncbi:MAG: radical SAM protein [Acidobacteriota bacterium]|nr:radical SAM protein [Acidobacteriota bacterium]
MNYANQASLTLDEQVGKKVSFVSGLSIPFSLPAGLPEEVKAELIGYRFFIPAKEFADYEELVRERLTSALMNSHGLIIMPTEKCNFRCTYCYEDFLRGRMPDENADALSKAIARIASTADDFSLSFFGGEPLLCSDLVLRFSGEAFEIMNRRGLPYSAGIATNGYLLDRELFEDLLDVGVVSYQITIDGSREIHDKQRLTASGQSTFERIIGNINMMADVDADFWCVVRCNVKRQDYQHVLSLFGEGDLARIREDKRFLVDVHEIWASDGFEFVHHEEDAGCFSALGQQMDFYSLNKELETLGFATTTYSERVQGALGNACYAGKPNWFVVGPNLSLYKCTVVFNREENKLGHIGEDGTLIFDELKNRLWTGSNALTDKGCSSCHYRIPCGGIACPLTRFTEGSKVCPDIKQPANLQSWANAVATKEQHREDSV